MAAIIHQIYRDRFQRRNPAVFREHYDPLAEYDDVQLYQRFRFRRDDINRITEIVKDDLEFAYRRKGYLSPHLQVVIALRFYASGSFQNIIGDTVHVHRWTTGKAIHRVTAALCARARRYLCLPSQAQADRQKRKFYAASRFPNTFACVDGTQILIQAPTHNEHEFVNRRGKHSLNVQIVCDADLRIVNAVVKYPGSIHDARILRESSLWLQFEQRPKLLDGFILGDSAYPLRDWLLTLILNPQTHRERRYNNFFKTARVTVERCIGVLKRRFHCLHGELRYSPTSACKIIIACLVLHNLALEFGTPEPEDDTCENPDDNDDDSCNLCDMPPTLTGRAVRDHIVGQFF